MKKVLLFIILAIGIAAACAAQTISTKNISLEAAKKVVAEAVKYAKANNRCC